MLASIQVINKIEAIEGADKIELAQVQSWKAVVQKGQYKEGDKVLFYEEGAILVPSPSLSFMMKQYYNEQYEGIRIRTIKLRGVISQGLVMPIGSFDGLEEGTDMTELLKVRKYDGPLRKNRNGEYVPIVKKGNFPSFIVKTDEDKLQSNAWLWHWEDKPEKWNVTAKLDGMSLTAYAIYKEGEIKTGLCSRNYELEREEHELSAWWIVWDKYRLEDVLKRCLLDYLGPYDEEDCRIRTREEIEGLGICIQGEVVGPKCNGNRMGLEENSLYVFNFKTIREGQNHYDLDGNLFCLFGQAFDELGVSPFELVPVLGREVELTCLEDVMKYIGELNPNQVEGVKNTSMEGVVIRACDGGRGPKGQRLSFKCLNPDYQIKNDL